MAASRVRADQRAARGTELRTRVLALASKCIAELFFEPVDFPARAWRKFQSVSLQKRDLVAHRLLVAFYNTENMGKEVNRDPA